MPLPSDDVELARRIGAYLSAQVGHVVRVGAVRRFPVGFSWLTYAVPVEGLDDGNRESRELILRLGPDHGLFAPYSARPQVLAMQSLAGGPVPVPKAYWWSDDPDILGAPFLFCEKARGDAVVPWVSPKEPPLEDAYRQRLGRDFVDAVAALHSVDWQSQPIAVLGQGLSVVDAAARTLDEWESHMARWASRPFPMAFHGIRWLRRHAPVAPRLSIVHGDYRTGNFLEVGGQITAILDWELVHLGDPHEDLAWASLPMYRGGTPYIGRLCEPDQFYRRYSEKAGFRVSMKSVRYWQVFSLLKLAATHMAAARCFEEGRFNDMRMPAMGSQVATCLRQMDKAMTAWEKETS